MRVTAGNIQSVAQALHSVGLCGSHSRLSGASLFSLVVQTLSSTRPKSFLLSSSWPALPLQPHMSQGYSQNGWGTIFQISQGLRGIPLHDVWEDMRR